MLLQCNCWCYTTGISAFSRVNFCIQTRWYFWQYSILVVTSCFTSCQRWMQKVYWTCTMCFSQASLLEHRALLCKHGTSLIGCSYCRIAKKHQTHLAVQPWNWLQLQASLLAVGLLSLGSLVEQMHWLNIQGAFAFRVLLLSVWYATASC